MSIASITTRNDDKVTSTGLDHRTVWRWHFYAGLFCIPFVLWLAITGTIFLFHPQIQQWLDRPFDHLSTAGPEATVNAQVQTVSCNNSRLQPPCLPVAIHTPHTRADTHRQGP